jgi:hypothetical protein
VGPRVGLDDVEKRKFLTIPGLELRPLGRSAIPTPLLARGLAGCDRLAPQLCNAGCLTRQRHTFEEYRNVISVSRAVTVCVFVIALPSKQYAILISNENFCEELIVYFPLLRHGPHRKRWLQQYFVAAGTCLPNSRLTTIGGYTDSPVIRHGPHRKRSVQQLYC